MYSIQTPYYKYIKHAFEDKMTDLMKKTGFTKYLQNDYLDQGYSLTLPFPDIENLMGFLDTAEEVLNEAILNFADSRVIADMQEFKKDIATLLEDECCKCIEEYRGIDLDDEMISMYEEMQKFYTERNPELALEIAEEIDLAKNFERE